jgi:hypothetical protein
MGERPDPEAKPDDSKGFDFDEASAGFRASWEDPAEQAPAGPPAAEIAAPTQVGLGPVAPPAAEASASPVPAEQPAQPSEQAVAVAPVQNLEPPKPFEATSPAPAPAAAAPAASGMKKTMLGIGNPLIAGTAAEGGVAAPGAPQATPAARQVTPAAAAAIQRTMIGLAPVEPNPAPAAVPQPAPSTLVVHEPTPPPRSSPVASTQPLPSVVVKESAPPPLAAPAPRADSVWDDAQPARPVANLPGDFGAPARRNEAFVSDAEIAALGAKKSRGVVFVVLGAAAILLAVVGVKVLMDRGSDGEDGDARVTAVPKAADPAPDPAPPAPPPQPETTTATAPEPTPQEKPTAAPAEEPARAAEPPPKEAVKEEAAKEPPAPRQAKRRAAPPPRKPAPVARRPRATPKPAEEPAPPKAGSGAIVRETPF